MKTRIFIAGFLAVLTVLLALIGIVLGTDADLKSYLPIALYALPVVIILFIAVSIWAVVPEFKLTREQLNEQQIIVNNAEALLTQYPELEDIAGDDRGKHLKQWRETAHDLVEKSFFSQRARQLFVDLLCLVIPAMLRHARESDDFMLIIDLSRNAYKKARRMGELDDTIYELARGLATVKIGRITRRSKDTKMWGNAAYLAYYIAKSYYGLYANLSQNSGAVWVTRMERILKLHFGFDPTSPSPNDLHARCLEVKGLLLTDNRGRRSIAKHCFLQAKDIAEHIGGEKLVRKIYFFLGRLEELLRLPGSGPGAQAAIDYYKYALDPDPVPKDVVTQLEIYTRLGTLAYSIQCYDDAVIWYQAQLDLAVSKYPVNQSRARIGLARALSRQASVDILIAYDHARKALDSIDQNDEVGKSEADEMYSIIIPIADKLRDKLLNVAVPPSQAV